MAAASLASTGFRRRRREKARMRAEAFLVDRNAGAAPANAKSPRRRATSEKQVPVRGCGRREFDLHQHFVRLQVSGQQALKEVCGRNPSFVRAGL